jgi:uncharacterized protein (DUF2461 family)
VTRRTAAVDASAGFTGFSPAALRFLRGLAQRNEKPWFEAHRAEYEATVKAPLVALVEELDARLGAIAPEFVGDRKRSVFRIHRDVRFSKDKSPYKTHAAAWFFHRDVRAGAPRDAGVERPGASGSGASGGGASGGGASALGSAGFYFHLEPGASLVAGGIYMPPRPALARIRERLVVRTTEWEGIVGASAFRRRFGDLDDEAMLVRMPRGFAADHPAARWLRYQSFTVSQSLSDDEATRADLPDRLTRAFTTLVPFVRWLNAGLGLRAAERR